jgi:hypothetical protein
MRKLVSYTFSFLFFVFDLFSIELYSLLHYLYAFSNNKPGPGFAMTFAFPGARHCEGCNAISIKKERQSTRSNCFVPLVLAMTFATDLRSSQ